MDGIETLKCNLGVYCENYEIVTCIEAFMSFEGLDYDILECKFYQSCNHNLATPHIVIIPLIEFTAFLSMKAASSFNVIYIPSFIIVNKQMAYQDANCLSQKSPLGSPTLTNSSYSPSSWEKS